MGRPPKGKRTLTKLDILTHALQLINRGGTAALTFRALAGELGVTPMAVAHHVGNRQEMMGDLVDLAFVGVDAPSDASDPKQRLRDLMHRYCGRVIRNPALARCILGDPSLLADPLKGLTELLRAEIAATGIGREEADTLLDLAVDYTHGFAFAAAAAGPEQPLTLDDYARGLDWILERTGRS